MAIPKLGRRHAIGLPEETVKIGKIIKSSIFSDVQYGRRSGQQQAGGNGEPVAV